MSQPSRNWKWALEKMTAEGHCRVCKTRYLIQAAHVIGRSHDVDPPMRAEEDWKSYDVAPDRVVPLCQLCHQRYDEHRLDLLPYLSKWEVHQAVDDCAGMGSNGLETARIRITGMIEVPA